MSNLARVLQSWLRNFKEGVDTAELYSAEIADRFLMYSTASPASPSAWLTVAARMFATVGVFAGAAASVSINAVAGLATMAAGASGVDTGSPPEDPRFDTFAELSSTLGDMKLMVEKSITDYFNQLFIEVPEQGNWEQGTQLARILVSGLFANQDIGGGMDDATSTDMTRMAPDCGYQRGVERGEDWRLCSCRMTGPWAGVTGIRAARFPPARSMRSKRTTSARGSAKRARRTTSS
ncbi:hypothetical protein IMZ48_40505 [Candidatus Bathyarchaeota archaeon]|nr:hypothetical protein [Candidatus Bathyarchaeota archaeon]